MVFKHRGFSSPVRAWIASYVLVPAGVRERNLVAEWLKSLSRLAVCLLASGRNWLGLGCRCGSGRRLGLLLGLGIERADLQLRLVLLQDAVVVVLPELLGRILAGYALEDLLAAGVIILELGQVIHIAVDDDVQAVRLVV